MAPMVSAKSKGVRKEFSMFNISVPILKRISLNEKSLDLFSYMDWESMARKPVRNLKLKAVASKLIRPKGNQRPQLS
jgi:hypothetical protein